jgi:hypothetical protein
VSTSRGFEIVVAGGFATNTVQVFNIESQRWTSGSGMPAAASYSGSTVPYGDSFAVIGGFDGTTQTDSIYIYAKETKTWSTSEETMQMARRHASAVPIPDTLASCV